MVQNTVERGRDKAAQSVQNSESYEEIGREDQNLPKRVIFLFAPSVLQTAVIAGARSSRLGFSSARTRTRRGESRCIIAARAVILTCIASESLRMGIYTIVIQPFAVEVYTRTSMTEWLTDDALSGNATIYLVYGIKLHQTPFKQRMNDVQASGWTWIGSEALNCPFLKRPSRQNVCPGHYLHPLPSLPRQILQGGYPWPEIANLSISVAIPPATVGVYMQAGQGSSSSEALPRWLSFVDPTPLLPGSHLFRLLYWTHREFIPELTWGLPSPSIIVCNFIAEIVDAESWGVQAPPSGPSEAPVLPISPLPVTPTATASFR
ncbi:hypothetical protein DFH09DRAFT_1078303 [Mycena vulgaris]|nr:hypothetical protein DFH09DRAFT_1078303 [Mycena vulgaris]